MSKKVIEIENVSFTYSGNIKPALKNINLKIYKGEIVMITGPSNAGKTTLARLMNGLIPHYFRGKFEGSVKIYGVDTRETTIGYLSQKVGLLFQDPSSQLVCPTVIDEVAFGPENLGIPPEEIKERVFSAIKAVRLKGYEERNPHMLSGGQQQACALAAIMAMKPEIYVLDEPTSNLDPLGSSQVLNLLIDLAKKENKTMIIIEHKMEELFPLIDRLIIMNEGKIIFEGKVEELFKRVDEMNKLGLKVPQVSLLAYRLKEYLKMDSIPFTLNDFKKIFEELTKRKYVKKSLKVNIVNRKSIEEENIIVVKNLWHIYPGNIIALRGVDLKIKRGEFVSIIGQNGSGKTTLVKHFNRLLLPTKGEVYIKGVNTKETSISELARIVGYVFQNPDHQICNETVRKELEFGPKNLGTPADEIKRRIKEISERLGIKEYLDNNPFSLSMGLRKRIVLASILTMNPEIIIVDEPTTGQDYKMSKEILEILKDLHSNGKTIIMISHDMELVAEYSERIIVLDNGTVLIDGSPRHVFSQIDLLERTYIKPPQVTKLGLSLFNYPFMSVDEAYDIIKEAIGVI